MDMNKQPTQDRDKSQPLYSQLIDAVSERDTNKLYQVLQLWKKEDENFTDMIEASAALRHAAEKGYMEEAQILLESGVNPNWSVIEQIEIPMTAAVAGNHFNILELLLSYNAKVDSHNAYGSTALHKAVLGTKLDCMELLLNRGADCNLTDAAGDTPIIVAAGLNDKRPIAMLLRKGKNLNLDHKNNQHRSALQTAVERNSIEIVKLLLGMGADANSADENYRTCLHMACLRGHHEVLDILLKMGGNPNLEDRILHTPIFEAAWQGNYQCIEKLIQAGARVDTLDRSDYSALALAASNGHIQSVDMILDAGCEVNKQGLLKHTALHEAACNGWYITVAQLLKRNADPNIQDCSGNTALSKSLLNRDFKKKYFKTWKVLVQYNTDLEIKGNGKKLTPLQLSLHTGHAPASKLLLIAGADTRAVQRMFLSKSVPRKLLEDPIHCDFVRDVCLNPCSLKQLCRTKIRKCLGLRIFEKVKMLPIPKSVQSFLRLDELDTMDFLKYNDIYPMSPLWYDKR